MERDPLHIARKIPSKVELNVDQIGNSRGVRLPKAVLERYEIKDALVLEAREEGLLLRACRGLPCPGELSKNTQSIE